MRLFFTGADAFEDPQSSSLLSLGGYPSSSPVPASGIDKIFGGISQNDMRNGSIVTKALVLKNETATNPVTGAKIYYKNNSEDPIADYRIAIVTLPLDSCGKQIMEEIANPFDRPVDAIFVDARNVANQLSIPDIPENEYIGIWIQRSINTIKGKESLSCETLLAAFDDTQTNNVQTITFNSSALAGAYFTVDTIVNRYVVWFNDGIAPMPEIASSYELLIVAYATGSETADTLAAKVHAKLQEIPGIKGEVTVTVQTNEVTVTNTSPGGLSDAIISDSNIVLVTTVSGENTNVEKVEDVELIITY